MIVELLLFCVTVILTFVAYKAAKVDRQYYKKRNIKSITQSEGLVNFINIMFNRLTPIENAKKTYNVFTDEPIYGIIFGEPTYVVRDPEIIKQIGIKDFDYFEDHQTFIDEKTDSLWGNSLLLMKGQKWRHMRATLSPAFTGSKMRQMYELVTECAERLIKHLKQRIEAEEKVNVEVKDLFTRYTNDVIASCAFGLKVDSFAEPNNDFFIDGKQLSDFSSSLLMIKIFISYFMPKLGQVLKLGISKSTKFKSMVLDTIEYRKNNNIFRPDMIDIMSKVREGSLKYQPEEKSKDSHEGFATVKESAIGKVSVNQKWNDDELVAQCFIFLIAGYDTTSTILMFSAYELVANPDIQQKLYEEIAEMNNQLGDEKLNYDSLQKMKYLDQVVCEVLRKWPPLVQLDRVCTKDYVLDDGKNIKFDVEKESVFCLPVYAIHHDDRYYPNPENFDPDRFSDENKGNILPETYLPFGIGPRNCIGSRFALMEIKAILFHLLLNFSLEVNDKTDIPFKLKKTPFNFSMLNGMHLELKPRSK